MRCLLLAKHRKGERNAKVDTEGEVLVAMAEKPWYKPVFGTLVVLGLVLIAALDLEKELLVLAGFVA